MRIKFIGQNSIGEWVELHGKALEAIETPSLYGLKNIRQWTGLLDRNGKEIYEGDILTNGNPKKEFEDIFEIKWDEVGAGFLAVCKRGELIDGTLRHWNHVFEIIGNIYSNPELLKQ